MVASGKGGRPRPRAPEGAPRPGSAQAGSLSLLAWWKTAATSVNAAAAPGGAILMFRPTPELITPYYWKLSADKFPVFLVN